MTYKKIKNTLVEEETGEIIDLDEIKNAYDEQTLAIYEKNAAILTQMGLSTGIKFILVRFKNHDNILIPIKKEYEFNKEFRVEIRDFMLSKKLSKNARCVIGTLSSFITFPTNAIAINGDFPSYKVLMNLIGISETTLKNTLKELESFEIIKRIREMGIYKIFFNPFLICGGLGTNPETYKLFQDSLFNPAKV